MESIRNTSARSSLRKTKGPPTKSLRVQLGYESSRCEEEEFITSDSNGTGSRRKVTLDPSLVNNLLNFSEDELSDDAEDTTTPSGNEVGTYSHQISTDSTLADEESILDYVRRKEKQLISPQKRKTGRQMTKMVGRSGVNYSRMAELLSDETDELGKENLTSKSAVTIS